MPIYLPPHDVTPDRWDGAVSQRGSTTLPWTTYASVSPTVLRPARVAFRIMDDPLFGLPHYWTITTMLLQDILQDTAMLLTSYS